MFKPTHIILTSNGNRKASNGCKCEVGNLFGVEGFEDMHHVLLEREGKQYSSCAREGDLYKLKEWGFLE